MKKFLLAAALLLPLSAHAQEMTSISNMPAGVYTVDQSHASLIFKVSHAGLSNYNARFKSMDAQITLDPKDPTKSVVTASIDPLSIETDNTSKEKNFNKELATGEQWFNAKKFPKITFKSTKIEKTDDKHGKMTGDLTLLGVTKPVTLDVTFNGAYAEQPFSKKPTLGFSATTTIKRSDWGFDTYVPMIGDDIQIQIEAEFPKKA